MKTKIEGEIEGEMGTITKLKYQNATKNVSQTSDDSTDQRRENNELSGKFDSDIDIWANHNKNTPENSK